MILQLKIDQDYLLNLQVFWSRNILRVIRQFGFERIRQVVHKNFKEFRIPNHLFIGL